MAAKRDALGIEELLAQAGWMRDLARRMVRDEEAADEILQDPTDATAIAEPGFANTTLEDDARIGERHHPPRLLVDDLIATGGTAAAVAELVRREKGIVAGCAVVIELAFLDGRRALDDCPVVSLISY